MGYGCYLLHVRKTRNRKFIIACVTNIFYDALQYDRLQRILDALDQSTESKVFIRLYCNIFIFSRSKKFYTNVYYLNENMIFQLGIVQLSFPCIKILKIMYRYILIFHNHILIFHAFFHVIKTYVFSCYKNYAKD